MRLPIVGCLMDGRCPQETSLDAIVEAMKSSKKIKELCDRRRIMLSQGLKDQANKIKKKRIPAFCPGAFLFDGKGRKNVVGLTNLCFLEIDHIASEHILRITALLKEDCHVLLYYRSISGDGLHFIVKYNFDNIQTPSYNTMGINRMNHTYGVVFNTLRRMYQQKLGVIIDPQGANMERLSLLSFDPDLFYNPKATPFKLIYTQKPIKRKPKRFHFEMLNEKIQ